MSSPRRPRTRKVLAVSVAVAAASRLPAVAAQPEPTNPTVPTSVLAAPATATDEDPLGGTVEGLEAGAYADQPPFDPASLLPVTAEVAAHRAAARRAGEARSVAQAELDAASDALARIVTTRAATGAARRVQLSGAVASRADLRRRAVAAYIRGNQALNVFATIGDPDVHSRAQRYLETMAGLDREAFARYERGVASLDAAARRIVDDEAAARERVAAAQAARDAAVAEHLAAERCVTAAQLGARLCVGDFRMPVLGDVAFANSWGYPRMPATPDEHWHEGIDVFAPAGREVVAVAAGTTFDVGTNQLGGLRLWLRGDDGTEYYYAHLAAIADGVTDGVRVEGGRVLGYVGDSGNASGGVPHLHFEVRPGGGAPVNPYPMLRAAWGRSRPTLPDAVALAGEPWATVAPLPPEERS